jgi:hypothetical protein
MTRHAIAVVIGLALSFAALSEVEKFATPEGKGISLRWWPKVTAPSGWHHDREHSDHYGFNAFAPDGSTFANADTVMYAKAIYKSRGPDLKSVDAFMARDRKTFLAKDRALAAQDAERVTDGDGKKLKSVVFRPKAAKAEGNWERVAYGQEGDFFLVFVLSSRTAKGYESALKSYRELVGRYKEKP